MDVYLKDKHTYRTMGRFVTILDALVLDALQYETCTVTVKGTDIGRKNTGDWLIIGADVYSIAGVKPQDDRTMLTLVSPLDAFSRSLEPLAAPQETVGAYLTAALQHEFAEQQDPVYAMPYLMVSDSDTTPIALPETDRNGLWRIPDYARLMRQMYRVTVRFRDSMGHLLCMISKEPTVSRQVVFDDGRSQLSSVDYSASAISKITVLQEIEGQEGKFNRSTWYLAEDGSLSQELPARRAEGRWETIHIRAKEDPEAKALQTIARNKFSHKLEFFSTRDLSVGDNCRFHVYGEVLESFISYKRKSTADSRFFYRSGELATTASEKLKGVTQQNVQ